MKQTIMVRCVGRNEELAGAGIILDPRPDEPQPEDKVRGFWLSRLREEAYQFEVGRLYEMTIEGPKEEPE